MKEKYQEALDKFINDILLSEFDNLNTFIEVDIKLLNKNYETLQHAINKANKYDEKETPKKPKYEDIGSRLEDGEPVVGAVCRNCNYLLHSVAAIDINCEDPKEEYIRKAYKENFDFENNESVINFCPNCGQKLDWGK